VPVMGYTSGRDIIQPADLPVTAGLQESVHEWRKLDEEIELRAILDYLAESSQDSRPKRPENSAGRAGSRVPHLRPPHLSRPARDRARRA